MRRNAAALFVAAVGLLVTSVSTLYVAESVRTQQARRFDESVERVTGAIETRLQTYVDILHATRGLFEASQAVSRSEFRAFVSALHLASRYPGVQGLGWSVLLPPSEVASHEAEVRAEGFTRYHVWPEGDRDVFTSIVYLEPFDWRNQRAFGYDMFSEPVRREAMSRARDEGRAVASAPVVLVQEAGGEHQAGFLIYLPVYRNETTPTTVEARRKDLEGWAYAVFRAGDLFRGIFPNPAGRKVNFEIYGGNGTRPDDLLFASNGGVDAVEPHAPARLTREIRLRVASRTWTLHFSSRGHLVDPTTRALPFLVLFGGLVVSALLVWVTRQQIAARTGAELGERRSAFLAEAGDLLSRSLDLDTTLQNLAHLAVPFLADVCAVSMREEGHIRLVAVTDRSRAGTAAGLLRAAHEHFGTPEGRGLPIPRVLGTGRAELHEELDTPRLERLADGQPGILRLAVPTGLSSAMFVPLNVRGETLGVLTFLAAGSGRHFGAEDLRLAEDLARRAALAIDNAHLYREAHQAVLLRDEFLSIASHELKTPLTSLHLQAQSMARMLEAGRTPTPQQVERKVGSISRQVDRLEGLINELLDVSRITSGRLHFDLEEVDLGRLVGEVTEQFEDDVRRADSALVTALDPGVVGRWDPMRLEQVVVNLLSNALKYGGGRPIHVRVTAEDGAGVLVVADRGLGIPAEDLGRIFERFERAVPLRNYGGLGLGLWISRRVVEGLGGTIEVESTVGEGSTFTVRLPLAEPDGEGGQRS